MSNLEKIKVSLKRLYGFRSGIPWKKIVAVLWYVFCIVVLVLALGSSPPVPAESYDKTIWRISLVVIVFWMLSPAVFLSNTPLREKLPLLKNHNRMQSLVAMTIVSFLFLYLFAMVQSWHSAEYKEILNNYFSDNYGF